MQIDSTPFERRIRARALVVYAILAFIATMVSLTILKNFLPAWFTRKPALLQEALSGFLLYVFFFLFTFNMLSRSGLSFRQLCGRFPAWRTLGQYSLWAIPLVIFSLSSVFLLYFPLSFFMPEFFQEWFIERDAPAIGARDGKHVLANLLDFFTAVLLAPIIEEFFFRGILLTRWTIKWGVSRSILASSLVFALLHQDPIGAFCFGCVMAIFYIRTKSLFIPMGIHIVNNSIPSTISWFGVLFGDDSSQLTMENFQELWPIGLLGFVILTPCAIYFWKRYIQKIDWRVPYLIKPPNSENDFYD